MKPLSCVYADDVRNFYSMLTTDKEISNRLHFTFLGKSDIIDEASLSTTFGLSIGMPIDKVFFLLSQLIFKVWQLHYVLRVLVHIS